MIETLSNVRNQFEGTQLISLRLDNMFETKTVTFSDRF